MREIAVSKFKATCLAVVEDVRLTRKPIKITRFGQPLAEIHPIQAVKGKSWLGRMVGTAEVDDDIVRPIGAFDDCWVRKRRP
jgi:hypothetical protein